MKFFISQRISKYVVKKDFMPFECLIFSGWFWMNPSHGFKGLKIMDVKKFPLRDINPALRKAEEKIINNQNKFRSLIENCIGGIVIISTEGKIQYTSPTLNRVLGYSEEEAMELEIFSLSHSDDFLSMLSLFEQVKDNPGELIFNYTGRMRHKDGSWRWIEAKVRNMLHDSSVDGIVCNFWDITERILAEEKLLHANRLYAFLSQINQTIVYVGDEQTLYKEACRIAIEVGAFKAAWIGKFDKDNSQINLVEGSGIPPEDLILFKNASFAFNGPQYRVMHTGTYYICNNTQSDLDFANWKSFAEERGINSFIILPIKKGGTVIGTLNVYSAEINYFDTNEVALLKEAAGDISFALDVFEKERQRKEAEEKLKHKKLRLKQAQAIAQLGSWEFNFATGIAEWSEEMLRIYGISQEEETQSYESWLAFIHPEDLDKVGDCINSMQLNLTNVVLPHRIIRRDGTIRHLRSEIHFQINGEGETVGLYGIAFDVTESKQAEDALKRSEYQYRQIVETAQEGIWFADENYITVFVNKKLCDMLEYSPEEMVGKSIFSFMDDCVKQQAVTAMGEKGNDIVKPINAEFTTKSGDQIITTLTSNPIFDEDGNYKGALSMVADVTEKVKLEDLLDKTNRISRIGNWEVDLKKEKVYWSDIMREILEVDSLFVPSLSTTNTFYKEGESNIMINQKVRDLIEKGIPYGEELLIVTPKGNEKWVRTIGEAEFIEGKCQRLYGSFQDIDERKRSQIEVLKVYEEKNVILESIADAFYAVDKNWVVTYLNKEAENLLGRRRKDILGKNLWEEYPELIDSTLFHHYFKAMEEGRAQHFEIFNEKAELWLEISAYPSPNGLSVYFIDETDRKNSEFKLKELNQNLEKYTHELVISNKNLEQFSYIVSHNLRTPVANIIGLSKVLNDELLAEEQKCIFTKELFSSVQVLDEVILDLNNILQMKREISEKKETVVFSKLVESIKKSISSLIQSENVRVMADFSSINEFITVKSYIYSIFYNLISNSIKYKEPGRSPLITIKSVKKGDNIKLSFKDNGSGIDMVKRGDQVFGLYKRFHPHIEGKGMGLFMVKTQVEVLGGRITCNSQPHIGTEFEIEFRAQIK
jgi:PAS domain S-box-containing protein